MNWLNIDLDFALFRLDICIPLFTSLWLRLFGFGSALSCHLASTRFISLKTSLHTGSASTLNMYGRVLVLLRADVALRVFRGRLALFARVSLLHILRLLGGHMLPVLVDIVEERTRLSSLLRCAVPLVHHPTHRAYLAPFNHVLLLVHLVVSELLRSLIFIPLTTSIFLFLFFFFGFHIYNFEHLLLILLGIGVVVVAFIGSLNVDFECL